VYFAWGCWSNGVAIAKKSWIKGRNHYQLHSSSQGKGVMKKQTNKKIRCDKCEKCIKQMGHCLYRNMHIDQIPDKENCAKFSKATRISFVRQLPNNPTLNFPDKGDITFRSAAESRLATYYQMLQDTGHIKMWYYEPQPAYDFWQFGVYRNKPYEYNPDYKVIENDGTEIIVEFKCSITTKDLSKWIRLMKHFDVIFDVVLERIPKSGKGFQNYAKALDMQRQGRIRRIIDARELY
jgi:hypothetical protein